MNTETGQKEINVLPEYLTVAQTAVYLGMGKQTLYNWSASDDCPLPKYVFGKNGVRFKRSDIDAYAEAHRQPTVKELKQRSIPAA